MTILEDQGKVVRLRDILRKLRKKTGLICSQTKIIKDTETTARVSYTLMTNVEFAIGTIEFYWRLKWQLGALGHINYDSLREIVECI